MQVEILPGKELTNPPEVSFELLLVTAVAKRKQRDSRDSNHYQESEPDSYGIFPLLWNHRQQRYE